LLVLLEITTNHRDVATKLLLNWTIDRHTDRPSNIHSTSQ